MEKHSAVGKELAGRGQLIAIFLVVLASRLPFLGLGFGTDPDSWRIGDVSKKIAETGQYVMSRTPGHPLQEYASAAVTFISTEPFVQNFVSALLSALLAIAFAQLWESFVRTNPFLPTLGLLAVPVIYISSTESIDFVWAACFVVQAFWLARQGRAVLSGLFIGFAIATRMTTLLFIPALWLCFVYSNRLKIKQASWAVEGSFALGALIGSVPWFIGPLLVYGLELFRFPNVTAPPPEIVLFQSTVGVWGIIGLLGIVGAIILSLADLKKSESIKQKPRSKEWQIVALAVIPQLALYIRLPLESNYLIPTLPFLILALGLFCSKRSIHLLSVCLCLSPFLVKMRSDWTMSSVQGPLLQTRMQREQMIARAQVVINSARVISVPSIIECGPFGPAVRHYAATSMPHITFVDYMKKEKALEEQRNGKQLWFLPFAAVKREAFLASPEGASIARPLPIVQP